MVLFVNCCAREESRTEKIAKALLNRLGGVYEEVDLYKEGLKPLDKESLNARMNALEKGDYSCDSFKYARQFANADIIVIAAPFWDLSFPAELKTYIENIYITGIVSRYNEQGIPTGLCKAGELYYVTTSGGPYEPRFSFCYVEELAKNYLGIKNVRLIKAEMLDVDGFCADDIVSDVIKSISKMGV